MLGPDKVMGPRSETSPYGDNKDKIGQAVREAGALRDGGA